MDKEFISSFPQFRKGLLEGLLLEDSLEATSTYHHSLSKPTTSFKQRAQLADVLYSQYESKSELCDVTLVIHGQEQKAHWSVLMSSPYFEALYQSGLSERQSGQIVLNFEDQASIQAIIKYLYTGTVDITMANVKSLLRVADYFLLPNFKQSCESFFSSYKSPRLVDDNCMALCLLGSEFDLPNLYHRASSHIIENFERIVERPEVRTLCNDAIESLVKTRELSYVKAEKMFQFIVSWTSHDLEGRKEYFPDLFCSLDLEKFTKESFTSLVESCLLVNENAVCKKFIAEFYKQVELGILRHTPEVSDDREVFVFLAGHNEIKYFSSGRELGYILADRRWTTFTRMACSGNLTEPSAVTSSDESVLVTDCGETHHRILLGPQENYQTFHKYCSLDQGWSWSTKKLVCPTAGFRVECLVACGTTTYVIGCMDEDQMPVEWSLYEIVWDSRTKNGTVSKMMNRGKLFNTNVSMKITDSQLQACTVQDRYICVMAGTESKEDKPDACFVVYDTLKRGKGRKIVYSSTKVVCHPILFPIGDQLIMVKMGNKTATSFNVKSKKFQSCSQFAVPKLLPVSVNRRHYMYRFHYNKLYIFGGVLCMRFLTTCFCFGFVDGVWDRLPDMPVSVWCGAMCLRQLAMRAFTFSHMHCDHCKMEEEYSFHCSRCWDNGPAHYPRLSP